MGFCQESSDEIAERREGSRLGLEMIREMGLARPDPFVFGPN